MPKRRLEIARQVADQLFTAEAAIDAAITCTAELARLMPTARQDARLSALIGQEAIERAIETMAALGHARRSIVETHKELTIAQEQIGLTEYAMGSLGKPEQASAVRLVSGDKQAA